MTHYLLTHCLNAGRMNYVAHTTPPRHQGDEARRYDESALEAAAAAVNQRWSDRQREQASFATSAGGLGTRPTLARAR